MNRKTVSAVAGGAVLLVASIGFAATASWIAVVGADVQGYNLYRAPGACAAPGEFIKVQSYGLVTTGSVPNPTTNGIYCHKLTAFNQAGESPFSNAVEFRYVVHPPRPPQNLTIHR